MGISAQAFINGAFRLGGILGQGQVANGNQLADGLFALNELLDSWNADNLNIFTISQYSTPVIPLAQIYVLGPDSTNQWYTQDSTGAYTVSYTFNNRPPMLSGVWFQQIITPPYNDLPVRMISELDWGNIRSKGIQGLISNLCYYDQNFPNANLYHWPIPNGAGNIIVHAMSELTSVPTLATMINLPPAYRMAVRYNLAVNISSEYGFEAPPTVSFRAAESKLALERNNGQIAQRLDYDAAVMGQPGGIYNVGSDQVLSWQQE